MFSIFGERRGNGLNRREMMRVGGLGFTGLLWSDLLRSRAAAAEKPASRQFGKAKSCIVIFNYGGPSHIDAWDLKPDAPKEIRGEFRPIPTSVPGVSIVEHLPRLAKIASQYALIRSVSHRDNDHAIGAYLALTGHSHPKNAVLGIEPPATPQDQPSIGSVIGKLRTLDKPVFSYVTLGELRHFGNNDSLGQNAGFLGKTYDPYVVPFVRPLDGSLDLTGVSSVMAGANQKILNGRRSLLEEVAHLGPVLEETAAMRTLDNSTRRAFELLASPLLRNAFNLSKEPQRVREHFGPAPFAQNCLLARRLVEAGVPLVTLYSVGNRDWDTHGHNFKHLKETLLPPMDRGVSSLLVDLKDRGMLDETLVIWMGDMGRTPKINKDAGRDHWSFCYSVVMAGGGVKPGQVYGSSDRTAAYPATNPVSPADIAATIYHCLGVDTRGHIADQQGRPIAIGAGSPVFSILG